MQKTEDFFQVFGHISVFFSTLDCFVTIAILRIVDQNHRAKKIAMRDETTLSQKFRLIQGLRSNQVIDPKLLEDLHALMPRALIVAERRNRFIHDMWSFNPDAVKEGQVSRYRIKGLRSWKPVVEKEEELTLGDLYRFLAEIGTLQNEFGDFLKRLPQGKI